LLEEQELLARVTQAEAVVDNTALQGAAVELDLLVQDQTT
jgi:hypothetical protein